MAELPTGTLSLLFSDIEGSTVLLHRLGARWGDALSAQRTILRSAFAEHDGTELGTEGDSFFVVFRSARDAVQAAISGQRRMAEHDWPQGQVVRVRMGIHTGEPERHEDGYIGEDVHRAARIGATAHGGQIVLSETTRRLLGELDLEDAVQLRDLGRHRLKDLGGDTRLFDVVVPGLSSTFPRLRSLGTPAALPQPSTPLIGRDGELSDLLELFADGQVRLVTLTGPGGSGKTRLAIAAATPLELSSPDGVYFVGLHAAHSAEAMWAALAAALDLTAEAADAPTAAVTAHLAARRALLVLDNLEQIEGADLVVSELLDSAAQLRILATSRSPLLLVGEREYPVPPLRVAEGAADEPSPAVQMFVKYGQLARPGFALTSENFADVAEVCRQVDGLPLAIELAAANIRLFKPHALLSRIDSRLGAGVTARDRPQRHRTLGATIAWSYDLLTDVERAVFRRLAVFARSCDLHAVSAVAMDPDADVLDVLPGLVGANMVRVEDGMDGEPRIGLLETIRRFALDRLAESGEDDAVRMRHLTWCLALVREQVGKLRGPMFPAARDALLLVEADARAALDWSLRPAGAGAEGRDRVSAGLALLSSLATYWYRFGNVTDARTWQERGLAVLDGQDTEADLDILHGLGITVLQQGESAHAIELLQRALDMAERLGNRDFEAREANTLAIARRQSGEYDAAMELLQRSLALCQETGNGTREATALSNVVVLLIDQKKYADAAIAAERAIAANERNDDAWGVAIDRVNYTTALLQGVGPAAAYDHLTSWVSEIIAMGDQELSVDLTELACAIAAGLGETAAAAALLASSDMQRAGLGMPRPVSEQTLMEHWLDPAQQSVSEEQWQADYARGVDLTAEQAVTLFTSITAHQPR